MNAHIIEVLVLILSLILAAMSAAAETGFTALTAAQAHSLEERGGVGKVIAYLRHDPNRFLSTILLVSSTSLIVASSVATLLLTTSLPPPWGEIAATVGISIVVLIFAELTPKNLAVRKPRQVVLLLAWPVRALSIVLRPVIIFNGAVVGMLMRLFGESGSATITPTVTEDEIRHTLALAEGSVGGLTEEETDRIEGILDLDKVLVDQVMRPRTNIVAVDVETPLMEALDVILQKGHSRIPVYEDSIDQIVGILYDKDLLKYLRENDLEVSLRTVARQAIFVPEGKLAADLLRDFQRQKVHIAIVLDEYGGTAGLVTIEDILEEIVGEIQDEYDVEAPLYEKKSDDEWEFNGMVRLEEVNDEMGLELPEDNGAETLGGFVFDRLGEVPEVGDMVEENGVRLEVTEIEGRRIKTVRVTREYPAPPTNAE